MPDGHKYVIAGERLFSPNTHEYYRHGKFTKKQKRHFMRLKSGMTLAVARKERLCFLTLTTKYDKNQPKQRLKRIKYQNYAFTKLKQKTERYLQKAMYIRHCKKHKFLPFELHGAKKSVKYSNLYARFRFKFKYFKLNTNEGGGVMHIVFRKAFNVPKIPFEWLAHQWNKIWCSPRVNISEIKVKDSQKLSMYLVGQYFAKQPVIRMSYGHHWVFQGFKKSFSHLVESYGFRRAIEIWQKKLQNNDLPTHALTRQTRFRWRKLKPIPKPTRLPRDKTWQSEFEIADIEGKVEEQDKAEKTGNRTRRISQLAVVFSVVFAIALLTAAVYALTFTTQDQRSLFKPNQETEIIPVRIALNQTFSYNITLSQLKTGSGYGYSIGQQETLVYVPQTRNDSSQWTRYFSNAELRLNGTYDISVRIYDPDGKVIDNRNESGMISSVQNIPLNFEFAELGTYRIIIENLRGQEFNATIVPMGNYIIYEEPLLSYGIAGVVILGIYPILFALAWKWNRKHNKKRMGLV